MGIVIAALVVIAGLLLIPGMIGYQSFAVISGSMEPNYPVGSIVYTKAISFEELDVGDVISFASGTTKVTHRIVDLDSETQMITTKGDANKVEDGEPVAYADVVGKVAFHVPLLGYLSVYIKTPLGIALGCGVLFVILLLSFLPEFFKQEHSKKEQ